MFKASLTEKLKAIFDMQKVSYDLPSESQEQECIWVEVETCRGFIKPPLQRAQVQGKIRVFGNAEKMPYGYFSKRINAADPELTKNLFFFAFEENAGTFRNIAERSMSFAYLYEGQYDPAIGEISEVNLTYVEE